MCILCILQLLFQVGDLSGAVPGRRWLVALVLDRILNRKSTKIKVAMPTYFLYISSSASLDFKRDMTESYWT